MYLILNKLKILTNYKSKKLDLLKCPIMSRKFSQILINIYIYISSILNEILPIVYEICLYYYLIIN